MDDETSTKLDEIDLTEEQELAVKQINDWLDKDTKQEFRLGGYAGTGKTTVIKVLTSRWVHRYAVVSLHRLIYYVVPGTSPPEFTKKHSLDEEVIVVDEASMVSQQLYDDLRSFGKPILFVGDPGQLEPVGDDPYLMEEPDVVLETIHRQARGSPILKFANKVRTGSMPWREGQHVDRSDGQLGRFECCNPGRFWEIVQEVDQVICGFNKTRHDLNKQLRVPLGFHQKDMNVGEKLICLRNHHKLGIYNGQMLFVDEIVGKTMRSYILHVHDESGAEIKFLNIWRAQLGNPPLTEAAKRRVPKMTALCDYGYVITAHKAQGSEWDSVAVWEQLWPEKWETSRWRYTAATRAAVSLYYYRG